jgi:hypothetical protein
MKSLRQISAKSGSRLAVISLQALGAGAAFYIAASLVLIVPILVAGWLLSLAVQGWLPASIPPHGGLHVKA